MKIVLFHPTLLPPRDYGGVERVVLWLARGLVERGHEVWVAALEGSLLPAGAKLLPVKQGEASAERLPSYLPPGIDVVHFQAPPEEGVWARLPCPGVLTVHGNGKPGERFPLNTVFLSQDHARRHGAEAFVYNGVDPSEYVFDPSSKTDAYLFLSKTSWSVKNVSGSIRLCARAGVPLQVAGGNRPWLSRLEATLRPSMQWVGPVSGARKARFLAQGKALVFPVLWPEPFGLVVVEALISGTPVLAPPRGSLSELVPPDVGAVLTTDEQWIEMLKREKLPWDPARCREWAMERFHYSRMAEAYELVYQRVVRGEKLQNRQPVAAEWRKKS